MVTVHYGLMDIMHTVVIPLTNFYTHFLFLGVAAILLGLDPTLTPAQIESELIRSSTPNKVTNAGTNSPNRLLYVERNVMDGK